LSARKEKKGRGRILDPHNRQHLDAEKRRGKNLLVQGGGEGGGKRERGKMEPS